VIGSVVGILAVRGARLAAYAVTAVVGLIGVFAVTMRPSPTFGKMLPSIVGTIVTVAVLWWLAPRSVAAPTHDTVIVTPTADDPIVESSNRPDPDQAGSAPGRRSFLVGAGLVTIGSIVAAGLGRVLGRRFEIGDERASLEIPEPLDTQPVDGTGVGAVEATTNAVTGAVAGPTDFELPGLTPFIVPNSDFYRIDTALSVPQVSKDEWSLRIHGLVDNEMTLTYADLLERPMIERDITLSCVSNFIGDDLVGNARWQGVRMKELLEEAGVHPDAGQVASRSVDGWTCGSPTSVIMDGRDAMLAIAMNGEPLPAEHGYPVRLVVPGLYGYVSATKWVTEIELVRWEDFDGYWVPRGWSKKGPIKTMARIDRPKGSSNTTPSADGALDIAGVAWAVQRGVSKVEVRLDGDEWLECELAGVPSDDTWRQWRYRWAEPTPGEHEVTARAYDGDGVPQPVGPKDVAPDGAEGYHTVTFTV
jgi:DMSO/TMAO reductase YedYZ molybdopterin-dependent catalytic subunit